MTDFVLDASAGVELLLKTHFGRSLSSKLPAGGQWWVPEHYLAEVAGVLRKAELKGVASQARITHAFHQLATGRLHRVQIRQLMEMAWSRRGHLTFADALYVVLAEQLGATLVTADRNLARSPGLKVPTVTP